MPTKWCINCKGYRDHAYSSCGGACNNNCYNRCRECGRETLVSTQLVSGREPTTNELIMRAQMSGETGEVTVRGGRGNVHTGSGNSRAVAYNTYTGDYQYFIVEKNK